VYGNNFVRPTKSLEFSANGNSHNLDLIVPRYHKDCWPGGIEFLDGKKYSVLIDNGINNESEAFKSTFYNATVIKICYNDYSWPVVARTMIEKAMASSMEEQLPINNWSTDELWAQREKYFLYLRDHPLRHAWKPVNKFMISNYEFDVGDLYLSYNNCHGVINSIAKTQEFHELWKEWRQANAKYIDPVTTAREVLYWLIADTSQDLTHITDVWTQAVIYYYIWLWREIEVPHNDYSDWFTNTKDIVTMLNDHGVKIDSH
jgi:hypothetical protein